jgi:hypothetical protein
VFQLLRRAWCWFSLIVGSVCSLQESASAPARTPVVNTLEARRVCDLSHDARQRALCTHAHAQQQASAYLLGARACSR